MVSPTSWSRDCMRCENRRFVVIATAEPFPCPSCTNWCAFCGDALVHQYPPRPQRGVLVAGVRTTNTSALFEHYVCDWHKGQLRTSSLITVRMIGRFAYGAPYIITQWGRALLHRYGIGEAANWQALEADAQRAVAAHRFAPPRTSDRSMST